MLLISNFTFSQSNLIRTSIGNFNMKYLGKGNWNYAKTEAEKIGYRLPTPQEFRVIMEESTIVDIGAALKGDGWEGWSKNNSGYFWTSKDNDASWSSSANYTNAFVKWWGVGSHNSKDKLLEKTWENGLIIAVKKAK